MKVLFCVPLSTSNPYVKTLAEGLRSCGVDTVIGCKEFWNEDDFDIIHFQWPEAVFDWVFKVSEAEVELFHKRIEYLKCQGVKIFITCHNLKPHIGTDKGVLSLYGLIYSYCDVFVHLGEYSREILSKDYPNAKHVIIPHHIYDTIYKFDLNKSDCQKELGLDPNSFNILCFGEFRTDEEREFIIKLMKVGKDKGWCFITPGFYKKRIITKHISEFPSRIARYMKYKYMGIKFSTHFIDDCLLEKFFTACDVVMIQRQSILNSGNLPMAFYAGKVVVGPDTGNVGYILRKTENPVFVPRSLESAKESIQQAEILFKEGKGSQNRIIAEKEWSTQVVVEQLSSLYISTVNIKK